VTGRKSPEQILRERAGASGALRFQWEIPGKVAGSARPGRCGDLAADLEMLRGSGIRLIVNLTRTVLHLPGEYADAFEVFHVPIDDGGPPDPEQVEAILRQVRGSLDRGHRVLVHCRGGIGRTATVLVPLLMELEDLSLEDALRRVRASGRYTQSREQKAFLEAWARSRQGAS